MAVADRQVGHLRLRAADAEDVRTLLPRLEDGLRCASLPDAGGRLLLVRRVDLGRIPRDASPQVVARLIEQRVAAAGGAWINGGTPGAGQANFVAFSDRLDARTRLAARLVRGMGASEWYWRLAVPEFRPEASAIDNLRAMAWTIASLPEATVALPWWATSVADDGGSERLIAAISEDEGAALIERAGVAAKGVADAHERNGASAASGGARGKAAAHVPYPAWLTALVQAIRPAMARPAPSSMTTAAPVHAASTDIADAASETDEQPGPLPLGTASAREKVRASTRRGRCACDEAKLPSAASGDPVPIGQPYRRELDSPRTSAEAPALSPDAWLAPTAAGGLLFLLHVLARLGIAECIERLGSDGDDLAARVCAAALQRLRIDPGDAFWPIVARPLSSTRLPNGGAPPLAWQAIELAPPRGRRLSGTLEQAWQRSPSLDALAELWLLAGRRWLRRTSGIGLASLIARPARLSATRTHIDVHFRLNDVDLRVRRAGLDLDPGWLPWFGRIVAFHFDAVALT